MTMHHDTHYKVARSGKLLLPSTHACSGSAYRAIAFSAFTVYQCAVHLIAETYSGVTFRHWHEQEVPGNSKSSCVKSTDYITRATDSCSDAYSVHPMLCPCCMNNVHINAFFLHNTCCPMLSNSQCPMLLHFILHTQCPCHLKTDCTCASSLGPYPHKAEA